jgi:hypothetical protein
MTDSTSFSRVIIQQVGQFVLAYENLLLISDRISSDSSLSAALAAAANAGGRTDLTTASFDNLNNAIKSLQTRLNTNDPLVNAATVKLPFYQII